MPKLSGSYVWHLERLEKDGLKKFQPILASKGRKSCYHFVNDAAEAPPVYCLIVPVLFYHFGSEILRSAANRHCFLVFKVESLGESEISYFNVACLVEEDVLGLETR
jgi:hypothetical protein